MNIGRKLWIPLVISVLALGLGGCFTSDACPQGWVKNATGDCVDPDDFDNPDGDQVLDPCPEGWVLAPNGFCEQVEDGDGSDGDTPDGDTPDGDVIPDGDGSDGDTPDGDEPSYRSCVTDGDCLSGELCHFMEEDGGFCLAKCSQSAYCQGFFASSYCSNEQKCELGQPPATCSIDRLCEIGDVCHPSANDGSGACYPACDANEDCAALYGDDTRRLLADGDTDAETDVDAEQSEAETDVEQTPDGDTDTDGDTDSPVGGYYCSGASRCEPGQPSAYCDEDRDCAVDTVCHLEVDGGSCLQPCAYSTTCQNYVSDFICNTEGRCIAPRDDCSTDADCEMDNICHYSLALCMGSCTNDNFCSALGTNLWCNAEGRCAHMQSGLTCSENDDCRFGQICHPLADEDGVCSEPCIDSQECLERIGPGLFCNAFNQCAPGDVPDGDEPDGDEPDGDQTDGDDPDGDADGDEDEPVECARIAPGTLYTINLQSSMLTATAKKGGQIYQDPYGQSDIYLRDNTSGNMFKIYTDFSDGGNLPAVEILDGNYNVWAENRFGQRKQVLNSVVVNGDKAIDVPFPLYRISINLTKNGQPFPVMDAAYRGQLQLYDRSNRRSYTIGEVGGGQSGYTIDVFASTYDIVFEGYLSEDDYAFQRVRLIAGDGVESDRSYNLDLEVATISGTIDLGGNPSADPDEDYGEIWLINTDSGKRFAFWPIDSLSPIQFSRQVVAGTYYVGYRPPGEDGNSYLWRDESAYKDFGNSQSNVQIGIDLVHFSGNVTWDGGDLYELYDADESVYVNRGDILLKNEDTGESRFLTNLGEQGDVNFDIWLGPGTYSYTFEGRLVSDSWFETHSYPSSVHQNTWLTGVDLSDDTSGSIDLPFAQLSGEVSVSYAGESVTDFSAAASDYIMVRRESTTADLAIFRFNKLGIGQSYSALLFPATYSMRFYGSEVLGGFQNNIVDESIVLAAGGSTHDIVIDTVDLGVTVTANNGSKTITQLIDAGVFSSAEIRVANEITRQTASREPDASGRFLVIRPGGEIDIFLYLFTGDSYLIYPLGDGYDLTQAAELSYDLDLVSFNVRVLKNGYPLPVAENDYSRGSIAFRSYADWRVDVRYDLGVYGEGEGAFTMQTGDYVANFSVGYGGLFPFLQYQYLECVNVVKPSR